MCQTALKAHPESEMASLTLAKEHVPHAQDGGPGQRSGEGTHEPFSHVEDGVDFILLQVPVCHGTRALEKCEQDLTI